MAYLAHCACFTGTARINQMLVEFREKRRGHRRYSSPILGDKNVLRVVLVQISIEEQMNKEQFRGSNFSLSLVS